MLTRCLDFSQFDASCRLVLAFLLTLVTMYVPFFRHVTACVAFGAMAVSFAHIVKSAEPVSRTSALH